MTVTVDYGSGPVTEVSGLNLNTVNGAGTLPATFKFGWAASTGGSNNIHEITGLTVDPQTPKLTTQLTDSGSFKQGDSGSFLIDVTNDVGAEKTTGLITVTDTLPAGLTPTSASGTGWSCSIVGQLVTCTRPGDGANALNPGVSAPEITLGVNISGSAPAHLDNTAVADTPTGDNTLSSATDTVSIAAPADTDGIPGTIEAAGPNGGDANQDGTPDANQSNVTSFVDPVTGHYAVLAGTCTSNNAVSVSPASIAKSDANYSYPVGLMNFTYTGCPVGGTVSVTQYYYGASYDLSTLTMRKFNPTTGIYTTIPGAVFTNVTIAGQPALRVTYNITDGGPLDQDGTANGTIVDPSGPAVLGASTIGPGVPNTGLPPRSSLMYYFTGLLGIGLLGYLSRRSGRAKGPKIS